MSAVDFHGLRWDEVGGCWTAESVAALEGWRILDMETFKPGVLRFTVRRGRQCLLVYVRNPRA